DFAQCFTNQSVTRRISLTSTARLPMKFGFVKNPPELMVQPNDGFGILLPFEERFMDITFSPASSIVHDSSLTFSTSLGQTSIIRCHGVGMEPLLSFSHTV
ncbi:unnamed protein product, partial [Choristocarpus tenellus]